VIGADILLRRLSSDICSVYPYFRAQTTFHTDTKQLAELLFIILCKANGTTVLKLKIYGPFKKGGVVLDRNQVFQNLILSFKTDL